jgi:uncharacterized protein YlxP (DUF503 family)
MAALGVLHLELHLEYAKSIKDERNVIRSLKARLRSRFNVAVATISHDRLYAEGLLQRAEDEAAALLGATLAGSGIEWIE